jgi:hypothetical protein
MISLDSSIYRCIFCSSSHLVYEMVRHGKTRFQDSWLADPEVNSWLRRIPGELYAASCKLCPGQVISVSTMGRQALISHMKSQKHKTKAKALENQARVFNFVDAKSSSSCTSSSAVPHSSNPCTSSSVVAHSSGDMSSTVAQSSAFGIGLNTSSSGLANNCDQTEHILSELIGQQQQVKRPVLDKYLVSSQVSRAEIIWCLQCVYTYRSNRSAAKDINVLKYMFPENEVLSKMQLERTKIGYLIVFGIAPFFRSQLLDEVKASSNLVISFDESLNKISQSQQMDLVVRFWSNQNNEVTTRYLTSAFLKRATASDLLTAFLAAVDNIEIKKLIQISMDGPNVNKKFLSDLKDHLSEDLKLDTKLIDLGTCGLHTVHCAFKASMTVTGWNIIGYLRAVYNFFKDHPARRGRFIQITGSTILPKKFCAIRWLENEDVAQNAIEMLPHLKRFVSHLKADKAKPSTKSFEIIEEQLKDPLLGAKIAFFKTISGDLQPLLREFQSCAPLAPFLYSSLRDIITKEMERFVIAEKLLTFSSKVIKNSDNFLAASKVDVGIGAKCEIGKNKDNVTMLQINIFKNQCRNALQCLVERLLEKSPIQFEATKLITSLDPVVSYKTIGQERFEKLLILLTKNNIINSQTAEKAQKEFKTVCNKSYEQLKSYKRVGKNEGILNKSVNRLDHFWMSILKSNDLEQSSLEVVIKKVLILSHGNSEVERGFSINKECIVENMKEESLVAIRLVHNAVEHWGAVEKVPITKSLISSSRNARGRYQEALQSQKNNIEEEAAKRESKRRNQTIVRELEEKKQKLVSEARKEAELIDRQILDLTKL